MWRASAYILFLCLLMLTASAQAGTPITHDMAQRYFENCLKLAPITTPDMKPETQKRYCACTAKTMMGTMSQEDLKALGSKDPITARTATNKVIVDVNAPCTRYPIHDMLQNKCMTDLGNAAICSCLSTKMAAYVETQSKALLAPILQKNPNIYDPTAPIVNSPEFQAMEKKIALGCATNPTQ